MIRKINLSETSSEALKNIEKAQSYEKIPQLSTFLFRTFSSLIHQILLLSGLCSVIQQIVFAYRGVRKEHLEERWRMAGWMFSLVNSEIT